MANTQNQLNVEWKTSGVILRFSDGVATVNGLHDVALGEMVDIHGIKGLVLTVDTHTVDVVVFGPDTLIYQGDVVVKLNNLMLAPIGYSLLGKTIDVLGNRLDKSREPITDMMWTEADIKAPGLITRDAIRQPLETGLIAVDSMIPIGRGQRELIVGDRNTGKTTVAVDTIINHAHIDPRAEHKLYCIYVAIGIRRINLKRVFETLKQNDSYDHTTIVSATASDPVSMQYMAAYVGCAIGEFFRDNQNHALVVYDDLSKHAVAYRQMSLLLRRAPGRDAYPGDIFYLHSRLLERAAKLKEYYGGGSLSAYPVIETQAEDLSAFVATNVISITDGQIYLDRRMFQLGFRPAVNVGLSVSRIGSHAMSKSMKEIAGSLKLDLAQYRQFEIFKSMSDVDPYITSIVARGERIVEILIQSPGQPFLREHQLILVYAARRRYLNVLEIEQVRIFKTAISLLFNLRKNGLKAPKPSVPALFQKIFEMEDKETRDYILQEFLNNLISAIQEEFPVEVKSEN